MVEFQNPDAFDNFGSGNSNNAPQETAPNAVAVLVLGILSILGLFCYGVVGLVLAIIALALAIEPTRKYRMEPGRYTDSSINQVKAGKICSWVTVGIIGVFVLILLMFGLAVIGMGR
jgi:hypothetical protein